jgi:hypothetical protein
MRSHLKNDDSGTIAGNCVGGQRLNDYNLIISRSISTATANDKVEFHYRGLPA